MLNRLPKQTATLAEMLPELGNPSPEAIAKAFDVTTRTAKGWMKNGAPRAVLLSLYWLTRPGQQNLDAELHNWAMIHHGLAAARLREIERLEAQIVSLSAIADFGSANDPAPGVVSGIRFGTLCASDADPGLRPTTPPARPETRRLS